MFAKHAGRKKVSVEDVMLLARRNESLAAIMKEHAKQQKARSTAQKSTAK